MKATLEFTLPEDSVQHQEAVDGWRWKAAMLELDEMYRQKLKYGPDTSGSYSMVTKIYEQIRADIRATCDAYGVVLEP